MNNDTTKIPLTELVLLPAGGRAALYRVQGDNLTWLETLPIDFKHRHALGGNRWIVAIVKDSLKYDTHLLEEKEEHAPYLFRAFVEHDGTVNVFPDVPLPQLALNQTLALKGEVVYLGGHKRSAKKDNRVMGEMAGFMDLRLENPTWNPLPLPVEMQVGKSIDDVLVYNDKLVLVDNIMYPKYLFEYDVSNPLKPVSTKTIELPNNGTYEHIHRGSINGNWLALLSSSVGRGGSQAYVSVFNLPTYEVCLTASLQTFRSPELGNSEAFTTLKEELEKARRHVEIHDFAVADNYLLVALGHRGLAVFYLPDFLAQYRASSSNLEDPDDFFRHFRTGIRYRLSQITKDPTCLRTVPGLYKVHKLFQLPDGRVVVDGEGEIGFEHTRRIIDVTKNDLHA
ncbi:hypothetical protein K3G39_06860 [Pontibacter sp. HSC-14F20]|uniref:hypothetical protein n=1 Tax=Pontibacter sp. HSC-14F20 TaxID=2864136 RepID=UPI001C73D249|nr:hypothetical protein [Pontibacter sp. HSC-14F20]MBX0332953.1 hypothetical protein [Pontibacter sp. HSC-14F20]